MTLWLPGELNFELAYKRAVLNAISVLYVIIKMKKK